MTYNAWREVLLEDVAAELTVGFVGSMTSEYVDSGIPFLRSKNVEPYVIKWDDMRFISREFHEKLRKSALAPGDVVIVRTGKPGAAALIPTSLSEANCSDVVIVRPGSQLDARFLVYYLNSLAVPHINAHLVGAVQQHFNVASARKLRMKLPPLDEQKAIAHILGTLDDKIELNQQMNRTLEAIARAIFKSWFVDFDPVCAKMDGRQPAGMDAATADLFPDSFEDSPLGKIPKGWDVVPIKDIVAGVYDGPHATPPPSSTGAVFLGIKNFTGTSLDFSDIRRINDKDWSKWTRRVTPQHEDIVFTYEATLGYFALIPSWLRCCLGRRIALVRPKTNEQNGYFLFHTFISNPFQDLLIAHTNPGSTVDRILLSEFPSYKIILPTKRLVHRFNEIVRPYWELIHSNQKQNQELAAIRDTLLPKLLSGEIRVKDAEKLMEAVA